MTCKWGCEQGCTTYGQHLRNKGIGFNGCFPSRSKGAGRGDATKQKKWDAECDAYRDAVRQGIEPDGTTKTPVEMAKAASDVMGVGYGTPAFKQKVMEKTLERL